MQLAAGKLRNGKRRKLAATTDVQGGHIHDSLPNSTNTTTESSNTETKLMADLSQRSHTWLKAGLITQTPRLTAYAKQAKWRKISHAAASKLASPPNSPACRSEEEMQRPWTFPGSQPASQSDPKTKGQTGQKAKEPGIVLYWNLI